MVEKLSKEICEALNRYYVNRENQSVMDYSHGVLKERGWNKAADLENIFAAAKPGGWQVEAIAGHFWFSKKLLRGTHIIEVGEKTLPQGGVSNIRDERSFSALADALGKMGKKPNIIDAYAPSYEDEVQNGGGS
jgi:hypothetical protein